MSTTADIERRAAEWLARQDRGLDDRRDLDAWLAESSANRVAYLRLKSAWGRADRLAALRSPAIEETPAAQPTVVSAARRPIPRRSWLAAAGITAVGVAMALVFTMSRDPVAEYQTRVGGREIVPLADGSRLELNTDTRLRARLTGDVRTVWLEQGEAYFEVARDERRPFVVIAGPRRVTVLGTKFSVRREGEDVHVKVVEGRVQVEAASAAPTAVVAKSPAVLARGQIALAKRASTLVAQRSPQEIVDELAWRQGMLVMNQWTLADAAREFNRYNEKKIVVDPSAAGIRLGGTFESGNIEVFSRLLREGFGLKVDVGQDRIAISN